MAQADWKVKGGNGKKGGKGSGPNNPDPKNMMEILTQHQVKNSTKFLEALASIGVKVPNPSNCKGKGKGKNASKGRNTNSPKTHPNQETKEPKPKGKGGGKNKTLYHKRWWRSFIAVFL